MSLARLPRLVALAALLAACDGPHTALPKPAPFIAFERDFRSFREWRELNLETQKEPDIAHGTGQRRAWVNALPPEGSRHFPVGTIFVREVEHEKDGGRQLFAMVKRGGGYNAKGAPGWEWFELAERADGSTAIRWRGPEVRAGSAYMPGPADHPNDSLGGCNGCHQIAVENDYVLNRAVRLDRL